MDVRSRRDLIAQYIQNFAACSIGVFDREPDGQGRVKGTLASAIRIPSLPFCLYSLDLHRRAGKKRSSNHHISPPSAYRGSKADTDLLR